jgi:hypothetical protein
MAATSQHARRAGPVDGRACVRAAGRWIEGQIVDPRQGFAVGWRRHQTVGVMNALDTHDVEGRSGPNRQEAEAVGAPDGTDEPRPERDAAVDPTEADASTRLPEALESTIAAVGD